MIDKINNIVWNWNLFLLGALPLLVPYMAYWIEH